MESVYRKYLRKGTSPGGINCPCCGPAPGPKRKKFLRAAKRSFKMKHKLRIGRLT